jgi:hypothetical protein
MYQVTKSVLDANGAPVTGVYRLEWSTEPPKESGWYWVYFPHDKHPSGPRVVEVERHMSGYLGISNGDYLESLDEYTGPIKGHWLGPLPIPEPPQGE